MDQWIVEPLNRGAPNAESADGPIRRGGHPTPNPPEDGSAVADIEHRIKGEQRTKLSVAAIKSTTRRGGECRFAIGHFVYGDFKSPHFTSLRRSSAF